MAKDRIKFPKNLIDPIEKFLHLKEKELHQRKKTIEQEDPFKDQGRALDNASPDTEAAEQFGHANTEGLRREIEKKLIQIRKALARIKIGKYGICEECGKMIDTDRLMIYPEATLCVECEKKKPK